jgi:sister-chromatid-cohesion protein PDS5
VLVERILNTSLVPYSLEPSERMMRLFCLYGNLDEHAVKALQEVFRSQMTLRLAVRSLLEAIAQGGGTPKQQAALLQSKVSQIARFLPEPLRAQEHLKKFVKVMQDDMRVRNHLTRLVGPDWTCKKAEEHVVSKELCKTWFL